MRAGLQPIYLLFHSSELSFLIWKCTSLVYHPCLSRIFFLCVCCFKDFCFFCSLLSGWSYDHLCIFFLILFMKIENKRKLFIKHKLSFCSCLCLFLSRLQCVRFLGYMKWERREKIKFWYNWNISRINIPCLAEESKLSEY